MNVFLWIWAWGASFAFVLATFRAQRWMNRWYDQGEELARALDREAGLKEALLALQPFAKHTRADGATGYRTATAVPLMQPGTTPRVVPPGGLESGDWGAVARESVPGLPPAGGLGAPGQKEAGGSDALAGGDDLKVVGTTGGKVRALRPPAQPDELPY